MLLIWDMAVRHAETVVSVVKWTKCPYYCGPLQTAVNLLFEVGIAPEEIQKLHAGTEYYREVHAAIEEQHARKEGLSMQEMLDYAQLDKDTGMTEFLTICLLRWGTVDHAAGELLPMHMAILLGILRRFAFGTLENKVKAAVAIASHRGFISSEHPGIKLEAHAQRVWAFFTRPQDLLQLALQRFVYKMVVRLFLRWASDDHDTGTLAMAGLTGLVRNVLRVLSRDIWLKIHGARNGGKRVKDGRPVWIANGQDGWGMKVASMFKTNGSEFVGSPSMRLLNPACECRVQRTLGSAADEQTGNATRELLQTFRILAMRKGPAVPEDFSYAMSRARPELYRHTAAVQNSFSVKMSEMQEFMYHVLSDVNQAVVEEMQRELFGLKGPMAAMTESTEIKFRFAASDGGSGPQEQFIVRPTARALANAVAVRLGMQDIIAHMEPQLQGKDISNFLPTYGQAVSEQGLKEIDMFLGTSKEQGRGENCNDARTLPAIVNCPPGENVVQGQRYVQRSLTCFPVVYRACMTARFAANSSKPAEGVFSTPAAMIKTKSRAKFLTIIHLLRRLFWKWKENHAFLKKVDQDNNIFWSASLIGRLGGWSQVVEKDNVLADVMNANAVDQNPDAMPARIKRGGAWKNGNFKTHSRTVKFSQPAAGSDEARKLDRMVSLIAGKVRTKDVRPDLNAEAVKADKLASSLQAIARKVRRKKAREADSTRSTGQAGSRINAVRGRNLSSASARRGQSVGAGRGGRASRARRAAGQAGGDDASNDSICDGTGSGVKEGGSGQSGKRKRRRRAISGDSGSGSESDESWAPGNTLRRTDSEAPAARVTRARGAAPTGAATAVTVTAAAAASESFLASDQAASAAVGSSDDVASAAPAAVEANTEAAADQDDDLDLDRPLRPRQGVGEVPSESPASDGASAPMTSGDQAANSDDGPLIGSGKRCRSAASSAESGSDSPEESDEGDELCCLLRGKASVHTYAFLLAIHNQFWDEDASDHSCWRPGAVKLQVAGGVARSATVTRRLRKDIQLDQLESDTTITFVVQIDDADHLALLFDDWTGAIPVMVTEICCQLPKDAKSPKWSNTAKYRRAYRSEEGLNRTDMKMDKRSRGAGGRLLAGEQTLKKYCEATKEGDETSVTYHVGDCEFTGDIRRLLGLVRCLPDSYRGNTFPESSIYPSKEVIFLGPEFSERPSCG